MKGVRGARKRGVERFWALYCPEALGIGSSVALKDKEANALRNLARLTSLAAPVLKTIRAQQNMWGVVD